MSNSKNVLAAFFNHHAMRPFFFPTQTSQTLCRRSVLALGDASPSPRQRLLFTSRPLCATITTSTSSSSSSSSMPSTSSTLSSSSASSSSSGYPPPLNSSFDDRMRRPSVQVAQVVRAPTQDDINKMELDAEVVPRSELRLLVTDRAAEQLRRISTRENDLNVALRVSVDSGGCHGYQYKLELISERQSDDYVFSHPSLSSAIVVVDAVSFPLLKGSTVDYVTELIGSTFRVSENPQAKNSGCGCGVSWELKL
ncbi:iron-sulfur cluster assembly accessory Isa2 [Pyrrhoderma noxium]|uniref:Iron-sulfur cluster assembly accessory Isa2 n=1 Tax=Pyrrhoderma noxium TaxID=2282107 RepID=A0A286UBA7_9AGAM|nr:iron-sulfur cluster assembly accessory Isa2 [Pyrrhoderma noxium]